MPRVVFEKFIVGICELTDRRRQCFVSRPKFGRSEMLHSWRDCPARCAVSASFASLSSLPASASRSIVASNRAASNASYQARNRARSPGASRSIAFSISSVVIAGTYHFRRSGERAGPRGLSANRCLIAPIMADYAFANPPYDLNAPGPAAGRRDRRSCRGDARALRGAGFAPAVRNVAGGSR